MRIDTSEIVEELNELLEQQNNNPECNIVRARIDLTRFRLNGALEHNRNDELIKNQEAVQARCSSIERILDKVKKLLNNNLK